MRSILEELKHGNLGFVDSYRQCNDLWSEVLSDIDDISEEELAQRLTSRQFSFESLIGDRALGKRVMAWSAFSHLYSCNVGFEENGTRAYKLSRAFAASYCSGEVKGAARKAAKEYYVEEYAF